MSLKGSSTGVLFRGKRRGGHGFDEKREGGAAEQRKRAFLLGNQKRQKASSQAAQTEKREPNKGERTY